MTEPAGHSLAEVGRKVAAGATWMVALQATNRLIGIVSLTILARLLLPEDFGLVALAMTAVAFIDMFAQTQVDVALIRDQTANREDYDSAWTLNILRGVAVASILAALAHPIAQFFSEPRLVHIVYAIAAIQLVGSFANIGIIDFRKHLRFDREFAYRFSCRLAGTVLTIALALIWQDVWVLVAGIGLRSVVSVILSYTMCAYRPRISFARFDRIFGFSKWVLVQNLFYELREQSPVFVIGRMLNADALGLFNLAKEISQFVTTEFRAPIRRALFPGFARMSTQNGELRTGVLYAFGTLLIVSLPLSVGLYLCAPQMVAVLLGPRWSGALPLLEILALYGVIQSFGTSSHLVYNRIGRPRFTAFLNIAHFVIFMPAVVWAVTSYGTRGAAWTITATAAAFLIADIVILRKVIGIRFRELAAHAWRPIMASACMTMVLLWIRSALQYDGEILTALCSLLILVLSGAAVYCAVVLLLWRLSGTDRGVEGHIVEAALRGLHIRSALGRAH